MNSKVYVIYKKNGTIHKGEINESILACYKADPTISVIATFGSKPLMEDYYNNLAGNEQGNAKSYLLG